MASKYFFFTGTAYWAKVKKPDQKYDKYSIDVELDDGSWEKYDESGLNLKRRTSDEEGREDFVKFSRKASETFKGEDKDMGPPATLIFEDGEYKPFDGLIGNGSFVNCKVQVYDTQRGKGHRLEAVAVETLVPYEGSEDQDLPF